MENWGPGRGLDLQEQLQGESHGRQKPGPRLAEVAGKAQWHPSSCLNSRLEHPQHSIGRGLEGEGRPALLGQFPFQPGTFLRGQQLLAMKIDGVFGVLERVAGEEEHDWFAASDLALPHQLFQAGEGDGRCRLAADAFRADLGLGEGDLLLR